MDAEGQSSKRVIDELLVAIRQYIRNPKLVKMAKNGVHDCADLMLDGHAVNVGLPDLIEASVSGAMPAAAARIAALALHVPLEELSPEHYDGVAMRAIRRDEALAAAGHDSVASLPSPAAPLPDGVAQGDAPEIPRYEVPEIRTDSNAREPGGGEEKPKRRRGRPRKIQ